LVRDYWLTLGLLSLGGPKACCEHRAACGK
jgi:hypothetical protein